MPRPNSPHPTPRRGLTLGLLLSLGLSSTGLAGSGLFPDVPPDHWARQAVESMAAAGILEGYQGQFHGHELIDRYQMAVILRRLREAEEAVSGPADKQPVGPALSPLSRTQAERALAELRAEVYRLTLAQRVLERRPPPAAHQDEELRTLVRLHRRSPRKPW